LAGERPSIMNMAWSAEGGDVEQGAAGAEGVDHSVPEDRSSNGPPLESLEASLQSSLTTSKTQRARRSAMLAFERELMHFSDQARCIGAGIYHIANSDSGTCHLCLVLHNQ
jgi:hypothetical protein